MGADTSESTVKTAAWCAAWYKQYITSLQWWRLHCRLIWQPYWGECHQVILFQRWVDRGKIGISLVSHWHQGTITTLCEHVCSWNIAHPIWLVVGAWPLNNRGFNVSVHVYCTVYLVKQHPSHIIVWCLAFIILCIQCICYALMYYMIIFDLSLHVFAKLSAYWWFLCMWKATLVYLIKYLCPASQNFSTPAPTYILPGPSEFMSLASLGPTLLTGMWF